MNMDRLDKITILGLAVLLAVASLLIYKQALAVRPAGADSPDRALAARFPNPEVDKRVKIAINLMEANDLEKADQLINDLVNQFPYDGKPYMAAGDLLMRKQDPVEAMLQYRKAIDLNPDFLDKKAPDFQGKKIKGAVAEAREIILEGLQSSPGDKILKQSRKTMYYMLRRIAGSCG